MKLGIEITSRCNARCLHCSEGCGPDRYAQISTDQWRRVMDEAAAIGNDHLEFSLTGGEPFLDRDQLCELVRHGTSLGAIVTCVSNGFWATNPERAVETLRPLADAGLWMLGVSTSRFHRQFVPLARVGHAIVAAKALGLRTVLKQAFTYRDAGSHNEDEELSRLEALADESELFPVIGHGRADGAIPAQDLITWPGLPRGVCPSTNGMIAADGRILACCTSGPVSTAYVLGTVQQDSLSTAIDQLNTSPLHRLLRTRGPAALAEALLAAGATLALRPAYADACDLCNHLLSSAEKLSTFESLIDIQIDCLV